MLLWTAYPQTGTNVQLLYMCVKLLTTFSTPTYSITGQTNHFKSTSVSSASSNSLNYFMRTTNVIPPTHQMPSRKRRVTETTAMTSHDMSSISSEPTGHQPPSLSSSAAPFSTIPFSQLPTAFSPSFSFSPLPISSQLNIHPYDPTFSIPVPPDFNTESGGPDPQQRAVASIDQQQQQQLTPTDTSSVHTDPDKDPFLSLLEQLAENEQSRGGPSELDFFLSASGG